MNLNFLPNKRKIETQKKNQNENDIKIVEAKITPLFN
jgi:hypothetical protein